MKKNRTSISQDIEEKIMSMYAKGMPTGDIEAHIRDIYGLEVSDTTVSRSFLWRKSGSSACHSAALSYVFSMSLLYDKRAVISTVTAFFCLGWNN